MICYAIMCYNVIYDMIQVHLNYMLCYDMLIAYALLC